MESDCSSESGKDNAKYAHSSNGIRKRVRVHKVGNNPWRRFHPSDYDRLDGSRCQAHVLVAQEKLPSIIVGGVLELWNENVRRMDDKFYQERSGMLKSGYALNENTSKNTIHFHQVRARARK